MTPQTSELIVFPTELALRRYQQDEAMEHGWVDASAHTTFSRLLKLCLPCAKLRGRRMDAATHLLVRNQVVDVARGHFAGQGTLGRLSDAALSDVLDQLVQELASLPDDAARMVDWMLESRSAKLRQLGILFSVWRSIIKQEGYADALDVNLAVVKLLRSGRENWPPLLRDAKQIVFRAVRWFNPFEEVCLEALNHNMRIRIETALPPAHAEAAADRLGQRIRSEIMTQPWAMWAEELGDALAVDSPDLYPKEDVEHIVFSRSAGAYGEIEDLARRICWELAASDVSPSRIALVVPDIGMVQDIIPHIFGRFRIPYYFRRGRPVLSSPCVKAFLAWLAFPLHPERDAFIDLLRNPAIRFEGREDTVDQLSQAPPRIDPGSISCFQGMTELSGTQALEIIKERIEQPEDHFNTEALDTLGAALKALGDHVIPLQHLIDLVEELLENATIKPRDSHEHGVWILNPHDAAGLDFDVVMFAGLNEGEFPLIPQQDALFNDNERQRLSRHLEEQGSHLPAMALPRTGVLLEQQAMLFLCALGMARRQLILSYQSADEEGSEKSESEYFRKVWNLAGWPAQESIQCSTYDEWRMKQLPAGNMFAHHLAEQQSRAADSRIPMPGESFLTIVPLPLCRATDEALQTAVSGGTTSVSYVARKDADETLPVPSSTLDHLVHLLRIEAERDVFIDTPVAGRPPSVYCGHIPGWADRILEWFESKAELSPTAMEKLAQCRYIFLLEEVFRLEDERMADDTPDPLDRGSLIHSILKDVYCGIANGESGIDTPRMWAVKTADGWRREEEASADAVALAVFRKKHEEAYVTYTRTRAEKRLAQVELGHPGVWAAEREKVLAQILSIVCSDARNCEKEGRFPALFELKFGGETAVDLDCVRLKGTIDRIDLIFSASGDLEKVRVLDYKGASRALNGKEDYLNEIRRNLDCQLPIYAFAAQRLFFGAFNTAVANEKTEAGYLFYERSITDAERKSSKSLVPMKQRGLIDDFLDTLNRNVGMLKDGDFSVDPLIVSYNDYESICRTPAVTHDELD